MDRTVGIVATTYIRSEEIKKMEVLRRELICTNMSFYQMRQVQETGLFLPVLN
jgi:hypothetical protein